MAVRCGGFLLLVCFYSALAQPLDWSGDLTLFGTSADEMRPTLVMKPESPEVQAFCLLSTGCIGTKLSQDYGESWSSGDYLPLPSSESYLCAVADSQYFYAAVYSKLSRQKTLHIFPTGVTTWSGANSCAIAYGHAGVVQTAALATDVQLRPHAPHLFFCWIERDTVNSYLSGWVVRSDDHGQSFAPEQQLFTTPPVVDPVAEIGLAAVGNETEVRFVAAATVDRPGSIGEAVTVFLSDDAGTTWSDGAILDSVALPQRELGMASQGMTVMLVYARRINAAAERDVFFTYSPDGGTTFSPPQALTESFDDDYRPSIVIHENGTVFSVFYLTNDEVHETATVWMRTGSVERPWEINPPVMICEAENAYATGGLSVCSNESGVAAAWTRRFPMGDLDVRFDASWRGTGISDRVRFFPVNVTMGQNYPNPFNGVTLLPLEVSRDGFLELTIDDVLGRTVRVIRSGLLPPGRHQILVDLSAQPSGYYFATISGSGRPARKMFLVK